jgi:methyl-accepting chemotaxis protein
LRSAAPPAAPAFAQHLAFDAALDSSLAQVASDTELSALSIIASVRGLHDTAGRLVAYLDGSSLKAGDLEREIGDSVGCAVEVGHFIDALPARMESDLRHVQVVVDEIKQLDGLVEAVQAIGMQSHLLAINASIEASHAGVRGAAFRIVAEEMRTLAANSGVVAGRITQGLGRARHAVESGMAASIADGGRQLRDVSLAAASIRHLLDNFNAMHQHQSARLAVVAQHNEDLLRDISEVLGQIQYQDVVRQAIERIRGVVDRRNACLAQALAAQEEGGLAQLAAPLAALRAAFLDEEARHGNAARVGADAGGELKIELF